MTRHSLEIDKNLWVVLKSGPEKFFILPSKPTHPGRFTVFDEAKSESFRASFYDVVITSPEAKYWINGYLVGSTPADATNFSGIELPPDHPLTTYFNDKLQKYWKSGIGLRDLGFFSPNCFNFLLQYLLKSGQVTSYEVALWAKSLGELETPKILGLSDPADLLKWIRILENANSFNSEELIKKLHHPADDVDAPSVFALYVSFACCRTINLFGKDNLVEAVNFFFKDKFWSDEADRVLTLLTDCPVKNKDRLSDPKFLKYSDIELARAIFSGLGLGFDRHLNPVT